MKHLIYLQHEVVFRRFMQSVIENSKQRVGENLDAKHFQRFYFKYEVYIIDYAQQ